MFDLNDFQQRLNSDAQLREEFIKDPVKTIEHAGLKLTPKAQDSLRDLAQALAKKHGTVAGSSIAPQGGISIEISKNF